MIGVTLVLYLHAVKNLYKCEMILSIFLTILNGYSNEIENI
ncbi:hypothetical protein FORC60_3973 [Bacillus cereus]|nr:hypothetical protein FORC60_3973 [Bacillus cereus]